MANPFENTSPGLTGISGVPFAVTPHDSTNFTNSARYFYVGGTGNIALVRNDDTVVLYSAVPAGSYIFAGAKRINSTNTTATLIVGHE